MDKEIIIAILSILLFLLSEIIPLLKFKCCNNEENINSVHKLLIELSKKVTQRNLEIHNNII